MPEKWSDTDKLKVFISIMDNTKINWDTVPIPEGRTLKAVKCMIDNERKKVDGRLDGTKHTKTTGSGTKKAISTTTTKRKRASKGVKVEEHADEQEGKMDGSPTKRKRDGNKNGSSSEDNEAVFKVKAEKPDYEVVFSPRAAEEGEEFEEA